MKPWMNAAALILVVIAFVAPVVAIVATRGIPSEQERIEKRLYVVTAPDGTKCYVLRGEETMDCHER